MLQPLQLTQICCIRVVSQVILQTVVFCSSLPWTGESEGHVCKVGSNATTPPTQIVCIRVVSQVILQTVVFCSSLPWAGESEGHVCKMGPNATNLPTHADLSHPCNLSRGFAKGN
jgi:hypothetical protein